MGLADNDLERRIAVIEDNLAIQEVVYNYCFKQDQRDIEGFLNLMNEDVVLRFRGWGLEVKGKEALKKYFLEEVFAGHEYNMHQITNLTIKVDGETAQCEAYLALRSSADGEPQEAGIRYMMQLRKEDKKWGLSEINCEVVTWKGSLAPQDKAVYERFTV